MFLAVDAKNAQLLIRCISANTCERGEQKSRQKKNSEKGKAPKKNTAK